MGPALLPWGEPRLVLRITQLGCTGDYEHVDYLLVCYRNTSHTMARKSNRNKTGRAQTGAHR
uniref:Uncharacterized protein n=1 Tax=Picea sitchensis TaxID=3332 RepID=A0A6B9XWJ2_PICSI|nr:hypothetical protein Q903MT_gene5460 [Picea sitchensis]